MKQGNGATLKKVLTYIGNYKGLVAASILLSLVTVISTLYVPILTGDAIDFILGKDRVDFAGVSRILHQIGTVIAFTAIAQWLQNVCNNRITFQVIRDIRLDAYQKIATLPLSYLDVHAHGDLVSRMIADVDQFADGLLMGFTQLFTGVITIVGTLIFMFSVSVPIAVVVVILTPLSMLVARFISTRSYEMFRLQSEARGEETAFIDEMIGNQKVVQAFSREESTLSRFDEINEKLGEYSKKAVFLSSLTNPSTRFVNNLVYAAVAAFGALLVIRSDTFTAGMLTAFLSYANQYTKPFNEVSGVVTELQNAIACAARVFSLIEEKSEEGDPADAIESLDFDGRVAIENVDFSYVPSRPLIENLNLTVNPGERVAIVGPTGAGKSTIINLLMRFYDVNSGEILLSGKNIRELRRSTLRSGYGMVLQETWLKTGTIFENIAFGRPDASREEVERAAKEAHAHSFIRRLSDGYDTVIGEDGGSLSEGQKQLLCIARVMLTLPPMLILDEATSSIDTRTEQKIQNAFAKLMEGRTSFIVAHRLSTIRSADVILVMKDGKIIEQGNHRELLSRGGFYAKLYHSQFG